MHMNLAASSSIHRFDERFKIRACWHLEIDRDVHVVKPLFPNDVPFVRDLVLAVGHEIDHRVIALAVQVAELFDTHHA